ncbi:hypothetical protein EUX98_g449 [Antrodiella citrinella]|uniref:Uncharacterized protein n=1 Tax=Antrodiella citrinella TaxID=2447956 RepID=A0A4S4N439_9APHY|nr:hypothetical protein EUX98_g449 [Antrodiella citrinella]
MQSVPSTPPAQASSTLASTTHSSGGHVTARKSPPPPKINLDDCKPTFATTAFVFTSSRTLRSSPPMSSVFTSPNGSPSSPPDTASSSRSNLSSRPSLSGFQLAKHSQGALDTRCVVGPNMRAAGFVPLAHNLSPMTHSQHGSRDAYTPSLNTGAVPTPNDPPPFPPIMFVRTRAPMWEYQREMGWADANRHIIAVDSSNARSVPQQIPGTAISLSLSPSIRPSSSTISTSASSSSSNVFSVPSSAATSMTSLSSVRSHEGSICDAVSQSDLKANKIYRIGSHTPPPRPCLQPVDGYPFPRTPSRKFISSSSSPKSSVDSFTTASEGLLAGNSKASTVCADDPEPASAASPRVPFHSHSRSYTTPATTAVSSSLVEKLSTPPSLWQAPPPSGQKVRAQTTALSLTELCDRSPQAWVTYSDPLGYAAPNDLLSVPGHKERGRGRSRTYTGDHRRGRRDGEKFLVDAETKENANPLEPPVVLSPDVEAMRLRTDTRANVDDKEGQDVCAALCLQDKGWAREHNARYQTGEDELRIGDHERHLPSRAQYGYSSFTFPPNIRRNSLSTPHRLGDKDSDPNFLDKVAKERDRGQQHKEKLSRGIDALVQMHRDRDREQARLSEREHCIERKFDPEADKVKAGNDDEIDVVLELEKDWEKSKKLHRRHKERRSSASHPVESSKAEALDPYIV